jgi:hypothetical protein
MREIRPYGSEGGVTGVITGRSYPYLCGSVVNFPAASKTYLTTQTRRTEKINPGAALFVF